MLYGFVRRIPDWAFWLAPLLLACAALRVAVALLSDPIFTPDTGDYIDNARWIAAMDFSQYTGSRTPGYPLFLMLTGFDPYAVRIAQEVAGLATVGALFYVGWALTRSHLIATLLGAWYGLNVVQVKYENTVLTESLTTLGLAVSVALLVGVTRNGRRSLNARLAVLGLTVSAVVLVRPAYVFLPVVILLPLVFSLKLRFQGIMYYLIPALTPVLAWSLFNFVLLGTFSPSTTTGYSLTNQSGPLIGDAPDRYSAIREVYLAAGQRYGSMPKNLIWRPGVIDEMMARTGQSFPQLSRTLTSMSLELFWSHPIAYLESFARSWREVWDPESFSKWEGMRGGALEVVLSLASRAQRWVGLVLNGAFFLLLAGAALWAPGGKRRVVGAEVLTIAWVVLLASVVQSAVEVAEKRYGVPLQPLTACVVLTLARGLRPQISGRGMLGVPPESEASPG